MVHVSFEDSEDDSLNHSDRPWVNKVRSGEGIDPKHLLGPTNCRRGIFAGPPGPVHTRNFIPTWKTTKRKSPNQILGVNYFDINCQLKKSQVHFSLIFKNTI